LLALVFSLPEVFHLQTEIFQKFIGDQFLLALTTLLIPIRDENSHQIVHSSTLSCVLDKLLLRFPFTGQDETRIFSKPNPRDNDTSASQTFILRFHTFCENDFAARRIAHKISGALSSTSLLKYAQLCFSLGFKNSW